ARTDDPIPFVRDFSLPLPRAPPRRRRKPRRAADHRSPAPLVRRLMGDSGGPADLQAFLTMPDFNVRSDSVDVEQIMEQIRARIREKRGVDYTEQQIRELAAVKLEKFLDPPGLRSDLLDPFRRVQRA